MERHEKKKHRLARRIVLCCILAVVVAVGAYWLHYSNPPYPETREIADEMESENGDYWFYGDGDVGFLLFAGAKTSEASYSYLAELLHEEGYTVVIPKQRFDLSIFGARHGMKILEEHTEVEEWILIGHSMGGWPVSRIAAKESDRLIGAVFLATYASRDLSDLPFPALRISAENDGIMNNERMDSRADRLPEGSESIVLTGANHRGFGGYDSPFGGDGEATITWQEQNEESIDLILEFYADSLAAAGHASAASD